MNENRCSVKHQVNSYSADEHDERDASQLRRSRVLLVRQVERVKAQARCQVHHNRAKGHKQAENAQRRMKKGEERGDYLSHIQALHGAALREAQHAQEKERTARWAAEKAEAAAKARATSSRQQAKQRFAKAMSMVKAERQRTQECVIGRLQRKALIREVEKQRSATKVRAAQSSRRSSITKDVRGQVTKALQPASPSSVLGPSRPQGKAYLGLLQRQKAAERGTVALRRARQQRQVEDLSRKLCKAQQANVPARQQADAVMTTPLKGSQVPCSLKCRHGAATFIRRQQSAAGSSLNRAAQIKGVAKGAMAPQQALLEVIAQTQWKLHNVEPQLHKYLTDSKIHHQRCTKLELHVDTPVQLESTKACVKSATLSNSGGSAAMQEDSLVPGRTGFSAPAQSKASGPKQEPPTAVYPVKQSDCATSVQSRFLKGHDVSIKLSSNPYFMFSTVEHTPEQLRASAPDIFSDNISHPVQDRLRCPMTFTKISSSDKLQLKQRSAPKVTDMVMDSSSPTMHKSHDAMGSEGSDEAFGLCPSGHYHSPGSHFRPALSPGDTEVVSSFAEIPSHEGEHSRNNLPDETPRLACTVQPFPMPREERFL